MTKTRKMRKQPIGYKTVWDQSIEAGDRVIINSQVVDVYESRGHNKQAAGELSYRLAKKPHPKAVPIHLEKEWYWIWSE